MLLKGCCNVQVHTDAESNEVIISGMGELHLEVYTERIRREYGIECSIGNPKVRRRPCWRACLPS